MILEAVSGSEIKVARRSAIPTQKIAASVIGRGETSYNALENNQGEFTVSELKRLYDNLGRDGKDTIRAWVAKIFEIDL